MPVPPTIIGDDTLAEWLISGGDDRLDCDPATGLNMYGYGPRPKPKDFAFSSSTASTISAAAFAHVENDHARLTQALESQSPADLYAQEMAKTRSSLLHLIGLGADAGLPGVDAIMAASGTDIHLFAAMLLAQQDQRTLMTITLKGSETGSGVMAAAAGRHFMGRVSSGRSVAKGEQLSADRGMRHMSIDVRTADGSLRTEEDVERELRGEIELVRAAGMRCLLVVTDVSKTGLIAPSLETALRLKAHFGSMLDILVDACQFRVSTATIRAYLEREFLVAVTGSKFLAGPIFCGALLCPSGLSQR
ncbi:MAG: hypothetical protein KGI75_17150, partial [Rhizobiaceae bacterium]|nr:hypothetical protein [Rhizobiaceae bacterium]